MTHHVYNNTVDNLRKVDDSLGRRGRLDIDQSLVKAILFGSAKELFRVSDIGLVQLSSPSLRPFLEDPDRSGEFCITEGRMDALLIQILSRKPPSDLSLLYSRDLLMDILILTVSLPERLNVPQMASVLEVNAKAIEHVVLGPAEPILHVVGSRRTHTVQLTFLNADRSGEFFVSCKRIDTLFIRILSSKPPSHPAYSYSQDVLMGVLGVLANLGPSAKWNPLVLATFIGVDPTISSKVLSKLGLSRLIFNTGFTDDVGFSGPLLEPFLKDASRSGEFFISEMSVDPFFIRILSSPSEPPTGSRSYSRDVLTDVLTVSLIVESHRLTVPMVASALAELAFRGGAGRLHLLHWAVSSGHGTLWAVPHIGRSDRRPRVSNPLSSTTSPSFPIPIPKPYLWAS